MEKYENVRAQCPLVILALIQTLSTGQLFQLLHKTSAGSALLLDMVSHDMEGSMDNVLASDQVGGWE